MHILLNPWGSLGDLYPFLALGLALKDRGADVTVASMTLYEKVVQGLRLGFVPVGPHFFPDDPVICGAMSDPKLGTQRLLAEMVLPALADSYAEIEQSVACHDVIVTSPSGLAATIASERYRKPWVGTALAPVALFSRYDAPILPMCPLLSRMARLSPWGGALLRGLIKRRALRLMQGVCSLRQSLGLKKAQNLLVDAYSPHLNLAMFDEVFGVRQPDWPSCTVQTGACLFERDAPLTPETDAELERFLSMGEPPVIVTLGSSAVHSPRLFFADCYAALKTLGLRGLFIMGDHHLSPGSFDPDRFMQVRYAPYSAVFHRAQAIVSHGGIGTLSQVLRAGKSTLVVPFSHDQPDNAMRIQRLGVGLVLPVERLTSLRAKVAIDHLIAKKDFAERASAVAKRLSSDGPARAASAVMQLASRSGGRQQGISVQD